MGLRLISVDLDDVTTIERITELNALNVPELGPADLTKITSLIERARWTLALVEPDGELAGFAVVFEPDADYTSVNYRYFAERYGDFVYLDRVAVAEPWRRRGVARTLYDAVVDRARGRRWFALEVNITPRNEASLEFHRRYGFVEIARQDTGTYPGREDQPIRVSLQVARLP